MGAGIANKKLLLIVGTRPEVIKMASLAFQLRQQTAIDWCLCSTGQHRSMLDETLADLGLTADIDLRVMDDAKGLTDVTALTLQRLAPVLASHAPDYVVVQGDTTTAMCGALAAFYQRIPVAHVEAGLRTGNLYSPWPEEANRKIISAITTKHFPPTAQSRANLLAEGIADAAITVTGNTVIDTLVHTHASIKSGAALTARLRDRFNWLNPSKRLILVTGHRRENFGDGFAHICQALKTLADRGDVQIVYPVHLNPQVRKPVHAILGNHPAIHLIEPQNYSAFVYLMSAATLILTDSGGIQEEAPSLGIPVLVLRDTSERPEAIAAGTAKLVGTNAASIVAHATTLLDDPQAFAAMSRINNPYGDGQASRRILEVLSA
ncbi:MAG: UDP-N-acetylglucosamine 2-epimerase (non-hydrolyzing) [Hyphomicrobiaceae bacterium]